MNLGYKHIRSLNPESLRLLAAVCMAILLIILVAGLLVFNFFPRNEVAWMPDQYGVRFHEEGIIFRWDLSFVQGVTINVLGFILFGLYFSALFLKLARQRRLQTYMITAILAMGISLAIELSQVYLPMRDSSLTDVVLNSAGMILGGRHFSNLSTKPNTPPLTAVN